MTKISFVIPSLNEESYFDQRRYDIQTLIKTGHEIVVVDGGSQDETLNIARSLGCKCVKTKASRGHQLHAGACKSSNEILVFLHADTVLPPMAANRIVTKLSIEDYFWGFFCISFTNQNRVFGMIAWFINLRSRISSIATGDQTVFIRREAYFRTGGFADIPLMEDIEFSKRLKKYARPGYIQDCVVTSSRKWEEQGTFKTIFLMWKLRLYYFFGVPAEKLAKLYYS